MENLPVKVKRVSVLIEMADGTKRGFEIDKPTQVDTKVGGQDVGEVRPFEPASPSPLDGAFALKVQPGLNGVRFAYRAAEGAPGE